MMKKLFAVLMISVCLIIFGAANVYASEKVDLMSEDYLNTPSDGDWEWDNGNLIGANAHLGDVAMMTDVFVDQGEHVVIEATGIINEGGAWGIILAEIDPTAPFASWVCLNMDLTRQSTRLFGPGVANPNEAELRNPNFVVEQPYTLALEITEDGLFKVYFNGEMYGERQNDNWIGAFIGLMTWTSSSTFTDFSITRLDAGEEYTFEKVEMVIVEQPYDVRTMQLGETSDLLAEENFKFQQNGEFKWENGKLIAPNAAQGDCAYMTDYFVDVDDHVYIEVTGNVTEGQAFGIMMPRLSYETPFDSWMCMNMEIGRPSTRLFGPGFAKEVQLYSDDFTNNKPLTIGLEIDKGTFYLYSDGKLFGYIENTEWQGCYVGLMTWTGSVEFTSFKISNVLSTEQYTVYPDGTQSAVEKTVESAAAESVMPEVVDVQTPAEVNNAPAATTTVTEAPQTFDVTVVCLAVAMMSGAAMAVSKKKN